MFRITYHTFYIKIANFLKCAELMKWWGANFMAHKLKKITRWKKMKPTAEKVCGKMRKIGEKCFHFSYLLLTLHASENAMENN